MKFGALLFIVICSALFTSCAVTFKSARQQVFFRGGPESGKTYIQTPDGKFEIEGGSGSYLMTRTNSDIPIKVTCPNKKAKSGIIETKFDWLVAGLANILNGGLGWFIDPFSDKSFNIEKNVSLSSYCKS